MNWKDQNRSSFLHTKSNLDQMVNHAFIDGNVAVIPCHAAGYEDLISTYSTKGYETLNPAFQAFLLDIVRFIPGEYPVVLEITGHDFTPEEQTTITETLRTDMLYSLGQAEEEIREAHGNFMKMVIGTVLMGIFLTLVKFVIHIAEEFFYIVFWFFADTLVRYLLHDRSILNYNKMLAGRLASMTVRFKGKEQD